MRRVRCHRLALVWPTSILHIRPHLHHRNSRLLPYLATQVRQRQQVRFLVSTTTTAITPRHKDNTKANRQEMSTTNIQISAQFRITEVCRPARTQRTTPDTSRLVASILLSQAMCREDTLHMAWRTRSSSRTGSSAIVTRRRQMVTTMSFAQYIPQTRLRSIRARTPIPKMFDNVTSHYGVRHGRTPREPDRDIITPSLMISLTSGQEIAVLMLLGRLQKTTPTSQAVVHVMSDGLLN